MSLTAQQIFDRIAKRAADPRKAMADDGTVCVYRVRGNSKLKCFAGEFISDKKYRATMERKNIGDVIFEFDLKSLRHFKVLMGELQTIHDTKDPAEWDARLDRLAPLYGCRYTPYTPPKTPKTHTKKARGARP